jgi:hypothetical protein
LSIFLLFFLLLSPYLKFNKDIKRKPIIHVLVDNSLSVGVDDSFERSFSSFQKELERKMNSFEIQYLDIEGTEIKDSLKLNAIKTDITSALNRIAQNTEAQSKAAILLSDGIVNKGPNPNYYPIPLSIPLYSIGLGDSSQKKDIWIENVRTNEFVLLGNDYPIRVSALTYGAKGAQMSYVIKSNGQIQKTGFIDIKKDKDFWQEQFMLKATSPGIQRIQVELKPLIGEINTENNLFELFVNVIDNRKKVSILYQGTHPDIGAIRNLLAVQKNYEISITQNTKEALKADVIVAVQWPNTKSRTNNNDIINSKKPVFLIGGETQNWNYWQSSFGNLTVQSSRPNTSSVFVNQSFSSFKFDKAQAKLLEQLPPMYCPFAIYPNGLKVLAFQKVNGVETDYPLLALSDKQNRMAVLFGEGLWRWKIKEYQLNKNNAVTEKLFDKVIQWLLSGKSRPLFSVSSSKARYNSNENVGLKAELYNSIFEPLAQEKVEAEIKGDSLKKRVVFNATGSYYESNLGILPQGFYSVSAKAKGQKAQTAFTVSNYNEELRRTRADWRLLNDLSERFNGSFYSSKNSNLLLNKLKNEIDDTVVIQKQEVLKPIIKWPYILGLIALLFTIEWILRKYYGRL